MGFAEKFTKLWNKESVIGKEKKASASAPLLVQFGANQPRFTPRRYDSLAEEGYQKNVIVHRCIKLIAQNAASVPWTLYQGHAGHKTPLFDHPLIKLLKQPNPMQGGTEMFEALYGFYLISGNTYLEGVGPDGSTPQELWTLRPDRMSIIAGAGGVPQKYRYSVAGKHIDYSVDRLTGHVQVLHIKSFHPLDDWYGMSPLEAAAYSIDQHNEAAKWNTSLLQNSGRPSGALVYTPSNTNGVDSLTDEQRQNLKAELEDHYTGGSNAGRPLVLEGGLDWREMSLSPKDMDWTAAKEMSAKEIALAYHIPSQLVGIDGSLTYSNFEQARLALYDDAVLPLLEHVKDELNNWLVPIFGDNLSLDYDRDAIEALAPRREKIWSRLTSADFMTVNEKRKAVGLAPIDGGDIL